MLCDFIELRVVPLSHLFLCK